MKSASWRAKKVALGLSEDPCIAAFCSFADRRGVEIRAGGLKSERLKFGNGATEGATALVDNGTTGVAVFFNVIEDVSRPRFAVVLGVVPRSNRTRALPSVVFSEKFKLGRVKKDKSTRFAAPSLVKLATPSPTDFLAALQKWRFAGGAIEFAGPWN